MGMGVGNAMRFTHSDLQLAIEQVTALREKARKAQMAHLTTQYVKIVEWQLIKKFRFKHELQHSPMSKAFNKQMDAKRKPLIDASCHKWDTTFDLMLYRITCPVTGEPVLLGKSIVGQGAFHNLLMRNLPVRDYHYQDRSDKPSHIKAADWRLRRKQWEEALPGIGVPMDNGLMIRLGLSDPPWPETQAVLRRLKVADLIERYSRRIIRMDRMAAIQATIPPAPKGSFSLGPIMRASRESDEYMNTVEGMKALVEEQFRLAACLPNPLKKEHISDGN